MQYPQPGEQLARGIAVELPGPATAPVRQALTTGQIIRRHSRSPHVLIFER
ncbi:hypothetical protein [Nonomuraea fuscirosea]|uniref:hypothetical protein n=1 Tax=Nonomuraea fuscirosea TaxID=1291556 RepID=UPI0034226B45